MQIKNYEVLLSYLQKEQHVGDCRGHCLTNMLSGEGELFYYISINIYSNSHLSFDIFVFLPFVLKWDVPLSKMARFSMAAQIMS